MDFVAESRVNIDLPLAEVFEYVSDFNNYADWAPGILSMKEVDQIPVDTIGKKYIETLNIPIKGETSIDLVIRHFEKDRLIRFEPALKPLLPRFTLRFTEIGKNMTNVQWLCESRNASPVFKKVLKPVLSKVIQKAGDEQLATLKSLMEAA